MKLYGKELADKIGFRGVYEDGEPTIKEFVDYIPDGVVYSFLWRAGDSLEPYSKDWEGIREVLRWTISSYKQEQEG